jgi:CubicO group peptidase (beta-lactamase class C family)
MSCCNQKNRCLGSLRAWALTTMLLAGTALANESLDYRPPPGAAPQPLDHVAPMSVAEMATFVDGFMASRMTTAKIAGATVAVVKDGALNFAKGYGYEDVDAKVPVDPHRTLFRVASITKLFTWTAVMQLVEQGKLDLDRDVNNYLVGFEVPATYPQPITLRHLMTHTPGFEDGSYFYPTPGKRETPMGEWLATHMPERVRPPADDFASGIRAAYSNYGAALAGHMVELVSGMSFDEYVDRHILLPLGMRNSSSREPLPPALAERMSGGYLPDAGGFSKGEFEFVKPMAPAGSISATAADMGRFMLALLNEGELEGGRILAQQTVRRMFTRALSPDPALNGTALGFYETYINARRVIGHGGDTRYFHSSLSLVPEANTGFFVVVNTGRDANWVAEELTRALVQRYFPARLPRVEPLADAEKRNGRYVGTYRTMGHTYTTYERIFSGFEDVSVEALPDGRLVFDDPLEGSTHRWIEVGDGVFRTENDDIFVAFKGESGQPTDYLVGPFGPTASERMHWYDGLTLHFVILAIATLLFVTIAISALRHRESDRAAPSLLRSARPVLALAGALLIASVLGLAVHFSSLQGSTLLQVSLTLALLAIVPTAAAVILSVAVWRQGMWRLAGRLHYSLGTLAALGFLWILSYWNLLGYHFG